jgi:hypothetical protein
MGLLFSITCQGGGLLEALDFFPLKNWSAWGLLEAGVEFETGVYLEEIRYSFLGRFNPN